jgi:parallel beta-helix repeat protein
MMTSMHFNRNGRPHSNGQKTLLGALVGALTIVMVTSVPAMAATYYVSLSGNDANSCADAQSTSVSRQKRSIAAGVACLAPGDTLYIRGGTYTGSNNVIDSEAFMVPSGTSPSAVITISGYPGEMVTIRPPDGQQAIRLTSGGPRYLVFTDLILDGINQTILPTNGGPDLVYLSTGAHHNRFQRLEVKNNAANGFSLSNNGASADYNEILDCVIHHNGRLDEGNTGYGIYLKSSNNLIQGNNIYANNGYGVHLNTVPGSGNDNLIVANRIHDNMVHGNIGVGGSTSYAIALRYGNRNLVANNLIYNNQHGILVYTGTTNALIYNNTITDNQYSGIDLQYYGGAPVIKNNIIYRNGNQPIMNYGGTGVPVINNNLTTDPAFSDAVALNFRLREGSAAKDAGVALTEVVTDYDGTPRPWGRTFDIGAYEYMDAPPPPSNVRLTRLP